MRKVEIVDVTLRDGEQTNGVSFTEKEKLEISKLLLGQLKVDRIEVASARISEGEFNAVKRIVEWTQERRLLHKVEILGFVDNHKSVDWIDAAGAKVINLLCKGSEKHVSQQLKKTPGQHLEDIQDNIRYAHSKGIQVNVYLEDWSNGMRHSQDYIFFLVDALQHEGIKKFMLPDTLGVLNPFETAEYAKCMVERYPNLSFDFHGHNDYDLSVANSLAAVNAGFTGVHCAINGLGERAGNTPLSSLVVALRDFDAAELSVNESRLIHISKMVALVTSLHIPENKPVIGDNVFTQNCGVHADGDSKGNLYFNDLLPERFSTVRKYSLGKTSGKANIVQNLKELGIKVDEDTVKELLARVVKLGDKKEAVTIDDLPFLVVDILNRSKTKFIELEHFSLSHSFTNAPVVSVRLNIEGNVYEDSSEGDGQYDAFLKCCRKIFSRINREIPRLVNYHVEIPPGGRSDALVKTTITWEGAERNFSTRGLDTDQYQSSINATIDMLNKLFAQQSIPIS